MISSLIDIFSWSGVFRLRPSLSLHSSGCERVFQLLFCLSNKIFFFFRREPFNCVWGMLLLLRCVAFLMAGLRKHYCISVSSSSSLTGKILLWSGRFGGGVQHEIVISRFLLTSLWLWGKLVIKKMYRTKFPEHCSPHILCSTHFSSRSNLNLMWLRWLLFTWSSPGKGVYLISAILV